MTSRKAQVINLWRTCFGDPEPFIHLYFEQVYREEHTLTLEKEGQVVSALQVLPYELTYYGETIPVGYICGVSTLPAEQGKGYMRQLMAQALPYLQQQGFALSFLIPAEPWLFDYYASMGYTTAFGYTLTPYAYEARKETENNNYTLHQEQATDSTFSALYTYINRHFQQRLIGLLHTANDLLVNLTDYTQSGGGVFSLRDSRRQIQGVAFTLLQPSPMDSTENELLVKECFVEKESLRPLFFQLLMAHFRVKRIWLKGPATNAHFQPMGMARLIEPTALCHIWQAHHPDQFALEELLTLPPRPLTQLLLNATECPPYLSLMLD